MKRYSLSINEGHYPHIADWLDKQANVSAAVRLLIQAQLNGSAPASAATVDLTGVRQVLEAVLDERLSGVSLNASPPTPPADDIDQLSDFDDLLG